MLGILRTVTRWIGEVFIYSIRQATVEFRVFREHLILARPTLFSPPIDVGRLQGSWAGVFHIRGDLVGDVEAGVDPGLLLERSHAGSGEGELFALTVAELVHKLFNIKVLFNTLFRVIKAG